MLTLQLEGKSSHRDRRSRRLNSESEIPIACSQNGDIRYRPLIRQRTDRPWRTSDSDFQLVSSDLGLPQSPFRVPRLQRRLLCLRAEPKKRRDLLHDRMMNNPEEGATRPGRPQSGSLLHVQLQIAGNDGNSKNDDDAHASARGKLTASEEQIPATTRGRYFPQEHALARRA